MKARRFPLSYYLRWPWWYIAGKHRLELHPNQLPERSWDESRIELAVGFLGDLMGLGGKELYLSSELVNFFHDTSAIVFNLEGPLQTLPARIGLKHQVTSSEQPLRHLRESFPRHRLIAGLANNHIDDVSEEEFQGLLSLLRELGIEWIGLKSAPRLELAPELELEGLSLWKSKLETRANEELVRREKARLLFVHFGDEFQTQLSEGQRELAHSLDKNDIALIGHHTHFPQHIEWQERYVAWSLGNLAVKFGGRPVNWGLGVKLGFSSAGGWQVCAQNYTLIRNFPERTRVRVEKVGWPTTFE